MGGSASPALQTLGEGQGVVDEEVDRNLGWTHWALILLDLTVLYPGAETLIVLWIQDVANTKDVFRGDQTSRSSSIWRFRVRQSVCWGGAFCGSRPEASLQGLSS